MEVDAFSTAALLLLLAALASSSAGRKRAARRREAERARARARRPRVPEVSANVRGLPRGPDNLWDDESNAGSRRGRKR